MSKIQYFLLLIHLGFAFLFETEQVIILPSPFLMIGDYLQRSQNITFRNTYPPQAALLLGFNSIEHCSTNKQHNYYLKIVQITSAWSIFGVQLYTLFDHDLTSVFKVNYFATSVSNPDIEIYSQSEYLTHTNNNYTKEFYRGKIDDPATYCNCFLTSMYCIDTPYTPFLINTTCQKQTTQLKIIYNGAFEGTCIGLIRVNTFFIAIYPNTQNALLFGNIWPTSISDPPIPFVTPFSIYTSYFIGLIGFNNDDGCLKFGLNSNNTQIDSGSVFNQLDYSYFETFSTFYKCLSMINHLPFDSRLKFLFPNFTALSIQTSSTDAIFNSTSLNFVSFISGVMKMALIAPINSQIISVSTTFTNATRKLGFNFALKIVASDFINVEVMKNEVGISLYNLDPTATINNFDKSSSELDILSLKNYATSKHLLSMKHSKSIIGVPFTLSYKVDPNKYSGEIELVIPAMTQIRISTSSTFSSFSISKIPNTTATTNSKFIWTSTNIANPNSQMTNSNTEVKLIFDYLLAAESTNMQINYIHDSATAFTVVFRIGLLTIKAVEVVVNSSTCYIIFINIDKPEQVSLSEFSFSDSSLNASSVEVVGDQVKVGIPYQQKNLKNIFTANFAPSNAVFTATVTDLKIVERFQKFEADIFDHSINLTLENVEGATVLPAISILKDGRITVQNTQFVGNTIVIQTKYNESLDGGSISLVLDFDVSTVYYDITTIQLLEDPPVVYCIARFKELSDGYYYTSMIIVILYWVTFGIGLFFCQKIYAIEALFSVQFAYLSLIPVGVYCPPFSSLSILKYSFGWNGIPFTVVQKHINVFYSSLGLKSNFISNVNMMLFPIVLFPLVYLILTKAGQASNHYKTKPRLLTYGKTFLLDVPFALILINTPNICTSLILNIQSLGISQIVPFVICILMGLLLVASGILFIVFRHLFRQFKEEFSSTSTMCGISIQKSTNIRGFYPFLLLLQISCLSSLLALESLFAYSLFASLGVLILMTALLMVLSPYKYTFDNIRLLAHRVVLIAICSIQIGFKTLRFEHAQESRLVYVYPWFLLVLLLISYVGMNFPYMIYRSIMWLKSKDIVDIDMYNKTIRVNERPYYPDLKSRPSLLYPALEFSRFRNRQERDEYERLMLLQIETSGNGKNKETQINRSIQKN